VTILSNGQEIDYWNLIYDTLSKIFDRLIRWADGRTLIVPLSGGYDSRLICAMLNKLGYHNVIAYSYGIPGNKEAEISKQVAASLNIPWLFIPYSHQMWYEIFNAEERKKYYRFADGLSSLPHLQDWPAVYTMKKLGILPEECAFIPGHTVTLLLEGFPKDSTIQNLVDSIFNKHYSLWTQNLFPSEVIEKLNNKIKDLLLDLPRETPEWAINAFETWEIQERQIKYIGNSTKVYDYFGYQWYMPLKDDEMINLWSEIPFKYRYRKKIILDITKHLCLEITGDDIEFVTRPLGTIKNFVSDSPFGYMGQRIFKFLRPM
jgi:asparagine synthase (glutamine-hydrolysing)